MLTPLTFIKDDAKKIGSFIKDAGTVYLKRDEYLVMGGAVGFYHAQQHGDPVFIQQFYDILHSKSKGHATMFRGWVGKMAVYELGDKTDTWMGFKDGKFFVKQGTDNIRKGAYEPDDLLKTKWFKRDPIVKTTTETEAFNELIASTTASAKRISKKWDDAGVAMPTAMAKLIADFEAAIVQFKK